MLPASQQASCSILNAIPVYGMLDRKIGIARNLYDAVLNLLPTHNTLTRISHFICGTSSSASTTSFISDLTVHIRVHLGLGFHL